MNHVTPAPASTAIDDTAIDNTITADNMPTSFGVFKPVGQLMIGLPSQAQADALAALLHEGEGASGLVRHFAPRESVAELEAMVHNAGPMAGFGYEIALLRRYLALAREGYRWLLVAVSDNAHAAAVAEAARAQGATLAVHYKRLTVEELI